MNKRNIIEGELALGSAIEPKNLSESLTSDVGGYVRGVLDYIDEFWVEMTGLEWKLRIIDILQELRENPTKYSGLIIRYKIGDSQEIKENPEVTFSKIGGVDHAAGAIMAELRKIRESHSDYDITLIGIDTR